MHNKKPLIALLRGIVDLLADESARNPEFAARVDSLLSALPESKKARPSEQEKLKLLDSLPDIHAEWKARGEAEFRLWLRDRPVAELRAVIRREDLDPTRRTAKWKEPEKLANFIADGLSARSLRGSAFIGRGPSD
jgi:hypothetical protein